MKILLLTPSKGSVCIDQRDMLMGLRSLLKDGGHTLATGDDTTSGLLHHSRNVLITTLADHAQSVDWGLWLDSDSWLSRMRAGRSEPDPWTLIELMKRDEEWIALNYPIRTPFDVMNPPQKFIAWARELQRLPARWTSQVKLSREGGLIYSEDGKLVEMAQSAFGIVLMRPSVALKFQALLGRTAKPDWGRRRVIPAFRMEGDSVGEDYSACRVWTQKIGGRIWCDPAPYVNNGQSGGRFADEIERCSKLRSLIPSWAMPA